MDSLREIYLELVAPLYTAGADDETTERVSTNPWAQLGLLAGIMMIFGFSAACEFVAIRETVLGHA